MPTTQEAKAEEELSFTVQAAWFMGRKVKHTERGQVLFSTSFLINLLMSSKVACSRSQMPAESRFSMPTLDHQQRGFLHTTPHQV